MRPAGREEVVLVVEDEQVVRDLVVDLLAELGYRSLQAVDGPSGLASGSLPAPTLKQSLTCCSQHPKDVAP